MDAATITGEVPYMFINDDSVEAGFERLRGDYPRLKVRLATETHVLGSTLAITGTWMDVFSFLLTEYDDSDADIVLGIVANLKPVEEDEEPPAIDRVCQRLTELGFDAYPDTGPGPTLLYVNALRGVGTVVLARDFNVTGWEAAFNPPDGDQVSLYGWLSADATVEQLALWAAAFAVEPKRCLDSERV